MSLSLPVLASEFEGSPISSIEINDDLWFDASTFAVPMGITQSALRNHYKSLDPDMICVLKTDKKRGRPKTWVNRLGALVLLGKGQSDACKRLNIFVNRIFLQWLDGRSASPALQQLLDEVRDLRREMADLKDNRGAKRYLKHQTRYGLKDMLHWTEGEAIRNRRDGLSTAKQWLQRTTGLLPSRDQSGSLARRVVTVCHRENIEMRRYSNKKLYLPDAILQRVHGTRLAEGQLLLPESA